MVSGPVLFSLAWLHWSSCLNGLHAPALLVLAADRKAMFDGYGEMDGYPGCGGQRGQSGYNR